MTFIGRVRRRLPVVSVALLGLLGVTVLQPSLAPVRETAGVRVVSSNGLNCPCYVMNYSHSIKTKTGLEAGNYTIALRWHATAGQVDGFVIDKSYATANNGFHDPRISMTPFRPLEWGPTYSIEVVAKVLSPVQHWKVGGDTGNVSAEIEGGPGDYDQHLDIDLHADGTWALAGQ
jgi:hypothetical protein